MADEKKKIDPYDVEALEKSLNASATRVSTIWVSYLLFGLYLVIAAANVTHQQLLFEEAVKLPVLNIDLPLTGFFFVAPILFVFLHLYILVQVLLLARTAHAYNEAIARSTLAHSLTDSAVARIRQRLANTLFAQIFAGSPREREGIFGGILRSLSWMTLAIAPLLVLLFIEFKFLPYHSTFITWLQRMLLVIDLLAVFLVWPSVLDTALDLTWDAIFNRRAAGSLAVLLTVACFVLTFPGERHTNWVKRILAGDQRSKYSEVECYSPLADLFPPEFDRITLDPSRFPEVSEKVKSETKTKSAASREGTKIAKLRDRDLRCASFSEISLRDADFTRARLEGARLNKVSVLNAVFAEASLQASDLQGMDLSDLNFKDADLRYANLAPATLRRTDLAGAKLQSADLSAALLEGAILAGASLHGARLVETSLTGSKLWGAKLHGANLERASLRGADLYQSELQGARLHRTDLQLANLTGADLSGADLSNAFMAGASFSLGEPREIDPADMTLAYIVDAYTWLARGAKCDRAYVSGIRPQAVLASDNDEPDETLSDVTPEVVKDFIEMSVNGLSSEDQEQITRSAHQYLSTSETDKQLAEQLWTSCRDRWLPQHEYDSPKLDYESKATDYLVRFSSDKGENQEHVAAGIYLNWVRAGPLSQRFRNILAGRLLALRRDSLFASSPLLSETKLGELAAER